MALIDESIDLFLDESEQYKNRILDPVSFDRPDDRHNPSGWYVFTYRPRNINGEVHSGQKALFLFPGFDIPDLQAQFRYRYTDTEPLEKEPHTNSGSSIATALAAGQAALILHCFKLGIHYSQNQIDPKESISPADLEKIKTFDGMKDVFKDISTQNQTRQQVSHPGNRFEGATKEMREIYDRHVEDPLELLDPVARLARNLRGWR
ncbi:hypothetical protein BDV95DRAFT_609445 [Massariosphaeria phaeospora]|uniref:Peptidase S8/S53 domain-containing protein n=1 Tax=Massariosphaeria phaeospora TaxID=100035 RepID=A0A7C8M716_9PLEO|nr:hypothetical protein BDV95DRAFT_609445 [Massariosphaeria phaeospora]